MLLSVLFLVLACFFNAVMDACESAPNFNESRLRNLPKNFWLKEVSWKYAPRLFGYRFDAWHISKSAMIICFLLCAVFFDLPVEKWQDVAFYLIVAGIVWNGAFTFFYHKIFRVK